MIGTAATPLMTAAQNKRANRIDPGEIQRDAACRRQRDDRIEASSLVQLQIETVLPAKGLGNGVGSGPGEHRHRQHAGADDAEAEQHEGERSGDRAAAPPPPAPRFRCAVIPAGCSVAPALTMIASAIRFEKAMPAIVSNSMRRKLATGRRRECTPPPTDFAAAALLDFLSGLPEKQIRADRRAENRDDQRHRMRRTSPCAAARSRRRTSPTAHRPRARRRRRQTAHSVSHLR